MSKNSKIQWTDATWPIVTGCHYKSQGCLNCYAVKTSWRLAHNPNPKIHEPYKDTVVKEKGKLKWSGVVKCHPERLSWVWDWKTPKMVFVCNMGDLFDSDVPDEFIDKVWAYMAIANWHTYQVLTKCPERMMAYLQTSEQRIRRTVADLGHSLICQWPLTNVWAGVTAENQAMANQRIPQLMATPAAVRFLSCEPLLENVDLSEWLGTYIGEGICDACGNKGIVYAVDSSPLAGGAICTQCCPRPDWVIVGGESGTNTRPCDLVWLRSLVLQCQTARVPIFVKQLGNIVIDSHSPDSHLTLRDRKGGDLEEWPEFLRMREFPGD